MIFMKGVVRITNSGLANTLGRILQSARRQHLGQISQLLWALIRAEVNAGGVCFAGKRDPNTPYPISIQISPTLILALSDWKESRAHQHFRF